MHCTAAFDVEPADASQWPCARDLWSTGAPAAACAPVRLAVVVAVLGCVTACTGRSAVAEWPGGPSTPAEACAAWRAGVVLADGRSALLGYWPLEDGTANELEAARIEDRSPQANHGALVTQDGAVDKSCAGVNGGGSRALTFDGADDHVVIPHRPAYLVDSGTVMLWARTRDATRQQSPWSKDALNLVTGGHLALFLNGTDVGAPAGQLAARIQSLAATSNAYVVSGGQIDADQWFHLAVSFGGGGLRLFRDGTLVGELAYTGGLGASSGGVGNEEPIAIGADTGMSASGSVQPLVYPFVGDLDEVSFWARELDDDEIGTSIDCDQGLAPER